MKEKLVKFLLVKNTILMGFTTEDHYREALKEGMPPISIVTLASFAVNITTNEVIKNRLIGATEVIKPPINMVVDSAFKGLNRL